MGPPIQRSNESFYCDATPLALRASPPTIVWQGCEAGPAPPPGQAPPTRVRVSELVDGAWVSRAPEWPSLFVPGTATATWDGATPVVLVTAAQGSRVYGARFVGGHWVELPALEP